MAGAQPPDGAMQGVLRAALERMPGRRIHGNQETGASDMSIRFEAVTTISCDGPEGRPCPRENSLRYHAGQATATRRATLLGWKFEEEVLCPPCQQAPAALAPEGLAAPVVSIFRTRPFGVRAA